MVTGHFDGDDNLDLAVADFFYGRLHVLLGTGDGQLADGGAVSVGPEADAAFFSARPVRRHTPPQPPP